MAGLECAGGNSEHAASATTGPALTNCRKIGIAVFGKGPL